MEFKDLPDTVKAMKEPKIIAEGLTNEEVYEWMRNKASNARMLQAALAEKQYLVQALEKIELQINQLTSASAVEVVQKCQDPTPHP